MFKVTYKPTVRDWVTTDYCFFMYCIWLLMSHVTQINKLLCYVMLCYAMLCYVILWFYGARCDSKISAAVSKSLCGVVWCGVVCVRVCVYSSLTYGWDIELSCVQHGLYVRPFVRSNNISWCATDATAHKFASAFSCYEYINLSLVNQIGITWNI